MQPLETQNNGSPSPLTGGSTPRLFYYFLNSISIHSLHLQLGWKLESHER